MSSFIIFDLDGTLVDTEYEIASFTADLAKAKGCPVDAQTAFRRYAGVSFKDKFNMIAGCHDRSFSAEEMKVMHEAYTARKVARYKNPHIPMISGARDLVTRLSSSQDVTLSLASSNETHRSRAVLSAVGLSHCFGDRVYGSDMAGGLKKPDPTIHRLAMQNCKDAIIVEDSIPGVVAARAAGALYVVAYVDPRLVDGDLQQRQQEYVYAGAYIIISSYDNFEARVLAMRPKPLVFQS